MADPFDPSAWPRYEIGPRDSVFAVGVASVNYAGLEFALAGIFANVTGLTTSNFTWSLLSKLNNHDRIKLMREALIEIDWPDDLKEMVAHFIDGFEILASNRNLLMHSNLVAGVEEQITLYKANRAGKTQLAEVDPAELRQVADAMMEYRAFGLALTTTMGLSLAKIVYSTLTKPPLPRKLDYTFQEKTPVNWYAVVTTASHSIQPYLGHFELLTEPRLLPFEQDGQNLGKLTYSGFAGYADYEGVLKEARELISVLTSTMRIRQGPSPLSIVNIVGIFDDGREEKFPPHGRSIRGSWGMPTLMRKPGAKPRPTTEQLMVEYVVRSGDPLVKDVLRYMSSHTPFFFALFKVLEVIGWDLGKGSKSKGYGGLRERGWVTKKKLKEFQLTADKTYRHWDKDHPPPQMDLQEARIMFSWIIEEWICRARGIAASASEYARRLES